MSQIETAFTGKRIHRAEEYEGQTGGEKIQAAIAAAGAEPGPTVVVVGPVGPDEGGRWTVTRSIELPSHTTLVLAGARLFLADGANCPLLQNRDFETGNREIHVVGIGEARLDGNAANQPRGVQGRDVEIWMEERGMALSRATKEVIGNLSVAEFEAQRAIKGSTSDDELQKIPNIEGHLAMRFYNVENLSVRGLAVGPTNYFVIEVERAKNVQITDITLVQDGREPNQAGIHIVGPAERIAISEIVGTCGDDVIHIDTLMPLFLPSDEKLSSDVRRANVGPVTGVTITNVVIRNRWCTGLLRTTAADGYPIEGIYASHLQLLDGEGYSEAHAVLKFGNSRRGGFERDQEDPAAQADITVENVFAKEWRGPYCAVFSPVKNLTIRGARGSHTGPFFHNFGQPIDGLILEDCRTTLVGGPDEPFVTGMIRFCLENYGYRQTLLEGTPAAIVLDGGPLKDIELREVALSSALRPGDQVAGTGIAGLRLGRDARVASLAATGLTIDGYESGILVERGVKSEALRFERLALRNVATPWSVADADLVRADIDLTLRG